MPNWCFNTITISGDQAQEARAWLDANRGRLMFSGDTSKWNPDYAMLRYIAARWPRTVITDSYVVEMMGFGYVRIEDGMETDYWWDGGDESDMEAAAREHDPNAEWNNDPRFDRWYCEWECWNDNRSDLGDDEEEQPEEETVIVPAVTTRAIVQDDATEPEEWANLTEDLGDW